MRKFLGISIFLLFSCSPSDVSKGVIDDAGRNRNIDYQVWSGPELNSPRPLILLSHGSGGESSNHAWLIKALVDNGYIVAAPNHPSNTTRDNSDTGIISVWERPADISLLLDHLLGESSGWSDFIDKNRIGAVGFSSGGYTVLALGGALYDRGLFNTYCNGENRGPDCDLVSDASRVDYSRSSLSYKDERIKSIFAMAPAVGPAITQDSLESIQVPVYIIASGDDELTYPSYHAARYANYIPNAELELLKSGGHFIFLECNVFTHIADWFIKELDLCGKAFDVDKGQIREAVASRAVGFFNKHIGGGPP